MTVQDVIEYAKAGELSQLAVKEDTPENTASILTYINLGLIELYKRFTLRTEEAIVTMRDGTTTYVLDGTDSNVDITAEVNRILEVYDETGAYVELNSETDPLSILTPTWNSIQVPYPSEGDTLSVIYTAPPIKMENTTDVLPIPMTLLEALLHYIGYRAHGSVDGAINSENNTHYMRFDASCKRVKADGLITQDDLSSPDVNSKGFV